MDKLQNDIRASKSTLITAKNNLASLEREATTDLSSHVETVRKQLKLADRDLLHTTIQAQSFLSQLELVPKASTSVDLEQQVLWVIDRLEAVLGHLNNAHQSVDNTISSTNIYVYKVMDIGEDVESKDRELSTHQLAANTLSTNAEAKLKTYQSNLEKLERKIREKEAEVKTKAADARYKRQRQSQLTAQIKNARCKAEEAQRERERRNKHAKRGAGLAILGVVAAPFTAGGSLVLTAAAGSTAVYKVGRMDDFEADASNLQRSVQSLSSDISQIERDIPCLEREKEALRKLCVSCENDIAETKQEAQTQQALVQSAQSAVADIKKLKNDASATRTKVSQLRPLLSDVKQHLDQCSIAIKDTAVEMEQPRLFLETASVVPTVLRRHKAFRRQKLAIERVVVAMQNAQHGIPLLLPTTSNNLLDCKPWNAPTSEGLRPNLPDIPDICRVKTKKVNDLWVTEMQPKMVGSF